MHAKHRALFVLLAVVALVGTLALPVGASNGGADKTPVAGTNVFLDLVPGVPNVTPGGVFHQEGGSATLGWFGDVAGTTTITYRHSTITPDGSRMIALARSDGQLTWDGRTGPVSGATNAICKADSVGQLQCGGTLVLHGSGDLDGVKFHIEWGPGFFAFPYDGFVLDPHA